MWYTTRDLEYWQNYGDCPQNSLIFGESSRAEVEFYMVINFENQISSTAVFFGIIDASFQFYRMSLKNFECVYFGQKEKNNMI